MIESIYIQVANTAFIQDEDLQQPLTKMDFQINMKNKIINNIKVKIQ